MSPYANEERRRVVLEGLVPATMLKSAISVAKNDFADLANRDAAALLKTGIPILLLTSKTGFIVQEDAINYTMDAFHNLTETDIGAKKRFRPENLPTALGTATRD